MPKLLKAFFVMIVGGLILSACSSEGSSQQKETNIQQGTYDRLVSIEPAKEMTNPSTRETVNFWIETWNDPSQMAHVYLQNADGDMIGYYVLDSPPVSMCTSLTPNFRIEGSTGSSTRILTPAPSIDGVYRGDEDCSRYYGRDATSGAYVEFTVGMGINMLLYTEPLTNHPNVENLAPQGE